MRRVRRRERGFTLIELMIAMVVSSLLVGMILAIFLRMSVAYRGQQQVAGIQQILASARELIETDAKHAGLGMSGGVRIANDVNTHAPVRVINLNNKPDQLRFIYADTAIQAAATGGTYVTATVDSNVGFTDGQLVIVSNADTTQANPDDPGGATVTVHTACILKLVSKPSVTQLQFDIAIPFGDGGANAHCPALTAGKTMFYRGVVTAYRIDQTRPDDGVLQRSLTGNLFNQNDWQDMGFGFTDLQVATQFFDNDLVDSPDVDTDTKREWYSGPMQETLTAPLVGTQPAPLQMTLTLVARTDKDVEGVATASTPSLTVGANPDHNTIGDRPAVDLTTTVDPALTGSRIFRYLTFSVDFRNTGVGR